MVLPSKTRLGKRKLEIKEVRKEKQITASKSMIRNASQQLKLLPSVID